MPLPPLTDSIGFWGDFDNDGRMDVFLSGTALSVPGIPDGRFTRVYRNNGDGTFHDMNAPLPQALEALAAWGDFDNDRDLDLVMSGLPETNDLVPITLVLRNDDSQAFTSIGAELQGQWSNTVSWVDFDNDGDLDISLIGAGRMYRNVGNGIFQVAAAGLPAWPYGFAVWADYDNDQDQDVLFTGATGGGSILFPNEGGFFDNTTGLILPRYSYRSSAWGDYDNDGDFDILISEFHSVEPVRVYRNDGGNRFTELLLPASAVSPGAAHWGDYDNDGRLDILLLGEKGSSNLIQVFRNDPSGFTLLLSQPGVFRGSAAWVDVDSDGDLDIFYTGGVSTSPFQARSGFYTNTTASVNTPPQSPAGLGYSIASPEEVILFWARAIDDQTPSAGLNYNLRVGRTAGGTEIMSPASDLITGRRLLHALGNAGSTDRWRIRDLAAGTYYWSVQAIDTAFAGSTFATEVTFTITNTRPIISAITNQSTVMDFPTQPIPFIIGDGETPASELQVSASSLNTNLIPNSGISLGGSSSNRTIVLSPAPFQIGTGIVSVVVSDPQGTSRETRFEVTVLPQFTNVGLSLPGVNYAFAEWGDYDNDGDLDFILGGGITNFPYTTTRIYRNNDDGAFTDINAGLPGVLPGSAAWGDYDNDGDLDLLLMGYLSEVYRNNGNGTFTPLSAGLVPLGAGKAAWADFDNDGRLDILVCGQQDRSNTVLVTHLYRNEGSEKFTPMATLPGEVRMDAAGSDYDNDGDIDLLLTLFDRCRLYRNDGDGIFTDTLAPLPGVSIGSIAWGDYDQDGWMDFALIGSTNDSLQGAISRIYHNNHHGAFSDVNAGLVGVYGGDVSWADYDNDGDLDLLLSGTGQTGAPMTRLYRYETGLFTSVPVNLPDATGSALAWGDFDNDGDPDLLLAGVTVSNRISALFRNDVRRLNTPPTAPTGLSVALLPDNGVIFTWQAGGDAQTTNAAGLGYNLRVGTTPGGIEVVTPHANVMTGLRRLPALGNVAQGTWRLLDLPRGNYYWSVQTIDPSWAGSQFSAEASFAITNARPIISVLPEVRTPPNTLTTNIVFNVGDFETPLDDLVLSTGSSNTNLVPIANIFFGGSGSNRTVAVLPANSLVGPVTISITVADPDGGRRSRSFVLRVDEFTEVAAGFPDLMFSAADWGDYDNDGDLDLLVTGSENRSFSYTKLYRNDGAGVFTEMVSVLPDLGPGTVYAPVAGLWGDYDNDGFLDVLLAGQSASRIFHNNRDGTFTDIQAGLTRVDDTAAAWADYDNDGDLDVLLSGYVSGTRVTRLYRNDGGNVFSNVVTTLPRLSYGAFSWGDFDNDGDLDVLLSGYLPNGNTIARVYRNVGDGIFHDIAAGLPPLVASVAWGDYDRDGDLDILVGGYNSLYAMAAVYRNNGNGTFSDASAGLPPIHDGTAAWADYDNDRWLDILLTGQLGNQAVARVYHNNGNGTFSDILAALPGVETGVSAWGDYDNDGDLDLLLAGGSVRGAVRLVRNNAPIRNTAPLAPTNLASTILSGGVVSLSWAPGNDSPPSVRPFLRYNLRIGTTPGGAEIMSPSSDLMNGFRRLAGPGNAGATNSWRVRVSPGKYYWSAQSINAGLEGSSFAGEASFTVVAPIFTSHSVTSTNEFRVSFTGVSGLSYSILASWDLNRWFVLGTAVETAPALFEFLDTTPTSGARFYRIRSP